MALASEFRCTVFPDYGFKPISLPVVGCGYCEIQQIPVGASMFQFYQLLSERRHFRRVRRTKDHVKDVVHIDAERIDFQSSVQDQQRLALESAA